MTLPEDPKSPPRRPRRLNPINPLDRLGIGRQEVADLFSISTGMLDQLNQQGWFKPHGWLGSLPRWDPAKLADEWRRYLGHTAEGEDKWKPEL
jgi:hypothetical protein